MPDYTTDPDRDLLDTSNTPREVRTGIDRRRGGGTDPEGEIDLGRVGNKGSDTGTETGVGLERGGMGRHDIGYTARLGSEGDINADDEEDDLDLDDEDELGDEEDEEDEDLELDDLDIDDDEEEDAL